MVNENTKLDPIQNSLKARSPGTRAGVPKLVREAGIYIPQYFRIFEISGKKYPLKPETPKNSLNLVSLKYLGYIPHHSYHDSTSNETAVTNVLYISVVTLAERVSLLYCHGAQPSPPLLASHTSACLLFQRFIVSLLSPQK